VQPDDQNSCYPRYLQLSKRHRKAGNSPSFRKKRGAFGKRARIRGRTRAAERLSISNLAFGYFPRLSAPTGAPFGVFRKPIPRAARGCDARRGRVSGVRSLSAPFDDFPPGVWPFPLLSGSGGHEARAFRKRSKDTQRGLVAFRSLPKPAPRPRAAFRSFRKAVRWGRWGTCRTSRGAARSSHFRKGPKGARSLAFGKLALPFRESRSRGPYFPLLSETLRYLGSCVF